MDRRLLAVYLAIVALPLGLSAQAPAPNRTTVRPPTTTLSSAQATDKLDTNEQRVERYLRNMYAWGPAFDVKVGAAKPSPIPNLLEVPVTVSMAGQSDTAAVFITKDGKYMMRGELSDLTSDPLADTRAKLNPGTAPFMGPGNAKVTLIEFADFECPSCRELDRLLRDFLPKHPELRLVYKHFPLTTVHPWAMTAAIASQCVIHQNPALFWKLHDAIFDAQALITPANVWDKMTDYARQYDLNVDAFHTCMANPEVTKEVELSMAEGRALNITGTPTLFVNGRRIVGPDAALLEQYTQFEAAQSESSPWTSSPK